MNENDAKTQGRPSKDNAADDLPAGDSPRPPAWQLPVAVAAWAFWIVFLMVMLWFRSTPPL